MFEDDQFPTGAPRPTIEEFADFLKSSVALEDLTLMEHLPCTESGHYRLGCFKRAQRTLPSLRKLVLYDGKREIHQFALSVHIHGPKFSESRELHLNHPSSFGGLQAMLSLLSVLTMARGSRGYSPGPCP
jgi:hypothetical protein